LINSFGLSLFNDALKDIEGSENDSVVLPE
jgi:hypothetical protein